MNAGRRFRYNQKVRTKIQSRHGSDENVQDSAYVTRRFDRTADVPKLLGCNTRNVQYRWSIFQRYLPPKGSVLDFGAGSLQESHYLSQRGYAVISCDLDADTLASYAADYDWNGNPPTLSTTGFDARRFDLIIAFDVFEHLAKPETILAEMRAGLTDDGLLFCTVPNCWTAFEIIGHIYYRAGLALGRKFRAGEPHLQFKSPRQWRRFFERCGFEVVEHDLAIGFFVNTWAAIVQTAVLGIRKLTRRPGGNTDTEVLGAVAGPRVMAALDRLDQLAKPLLRGLFGWNLFVLRAR